MYGSASMRTSARLGVSTYLGKDLAIRRMRKQVQMRGGTRGPHARRTLCTLSVRPRAPTKQMGLFQHPALEDVAREVLVSEDVGKSLVDVARVDRQILALQIGRRERNLFQQLLHHRVEAPGADVLRPLVD